MNEEIPPGTRRLVGLYAKAPLAACITKSRTRKQDSFDLLIIVDDPQQGVARSRRTLEQKNFSVTMVSKRLFERDARFGSLGEFVAAILLEPYTTILGKEYIERQEIDLKIRIIKEELENLALRFQGLLLELLIDPRFFFHAKMQRRAKIYPPLRSAYLRLLSEHPYDSSFGFEKALQEMSRSNLLQINEFVKVTRKLMRQLPKPGAKVLSPFREVELAIRRLATYGIASNALDPTFVDDITQDFDFATVDGFQDLPDPKAYLFLSTESGLVSMDDKRGYRELIAAEGSQSPRSIKRIGGVLNFVYLVEYTQDEHRRRVVAKTYQNWYGLKWIPLSIWTVGSQNFDIIGERRLSNEYRMNRTLRSNGLNAPEIYHVSVPRRTIIEEFIAGRGFDNIARKCMSSKDEDLLAAIGNLGEEMSRVHDIGVSLGDSKPNNMILDRGGRIWFVDLEQASEGGNPAWDLAEFLYYSGHYSLRWQGVGSLAKAFLEGYLRNGRREVIREISSSKYKRIFGVMTAPHIIMGISKLCRAYGSSS